MRKNTAEDFERYVEYEAMTGCWLWVGPQFTDGYGHFRIAGEHWYAHRWAYVRFVGLLDPKRIVCHNCFNKACVNPGHLRQDTQRNNQLDADIARTGSYLTYPCGHSRNNDNTYSDGSPRCRTCRREYQRNYMRRRRTQ